MQKEIFQEITDSVIGSLPNEWLEFIVKYQVEGNQSQFLNSYLVLENEKLTEKSIPSITNLDVLLRRLQDEVAIGNKERFTECIIHVKASGEFDANYSYEPIDWDKLDLGWNFRENA